MFKDREDAGRQLAEALTADGEIKNRARDELLVLSIPRGGVVVGLMVAEELECEHDVLISKKIGHPDNSELAIGAIAEDGKAEVGFVERGLVTEEMVMETRRKIEKYIEKFRGGRELEFEDKRVVILVDDGVATGRSMKAGLKWLKKRLGLGGAKVVVVAVPVGARESIEELREVADEVVCLDERDDLRAVGQFYESFPQVSDKQVEELLMES